MAIRKYLAFSLVLSSFLTLHSAETMCVGTWTGKDGEAWSNSGNWKGCIPGHSGTTAKDEAFFGSAKRFTIDLDANGGISPGVSSLQFNASQKPYTIMASMDINSLVLNPGITRSSIIDVRNNTATISAPITLNNTLSVSLKKGSALVVTDNGITGNGIIFIQGTKGGQFTHKNAISDIGFLGDNVVNVGKAIFLNQATKEGTPTSFTAGFFNIVSGTLNNINNLPFSTAGMGACVINAGLSIGSNGKATVNNTNNASISNTAIGSLLSIGAYNQFNHHLSDINNTNNGTVTTGGVGTQISTSGMNLSKVTIINTNAGDVDASSTGSLIDCTGGINLNSGATIQNFNVAKNPTLGGAHLRSANVIGINGGNLTNNDLVETNNIVINTKGTLAGFGSFYGLGMSTTTVTNSGGTVIAGSTQLNSSAQTMFINGNFTSVGNISVNLSSPAAPPNLNVNGTITLQVVPATCTPALEGTTACIPLKPTLTIGLTPNAMVRAGDKFTVITSSHAIIGGFSGVTVNTATTKNFGASAAVQGDVVVVTLSATKGASTAGASTSQVAKGSTRTQTTAKHGNTVSKTMRIKTKGAKANIRATKATIGTVDRKIEPATGLSSSLAAAPEQIDDRNLIASASSQIEAIAVMSPYNTREKQEKLRENLEGKNPSPWNVYFGPTLDKGDVLTTGALTGSRYWALGSLLGFNYSFSQVGIGLNLDYNRLHGVEAHHHGFYKIQQAHADLYGVYVPKSVPEIAVNTILGGGLDWYKFSRNAGAGVGPSIWARGNPKGSDFDAMVGFQYALSDSQINGMTKGLEIIPEVDATYLLFNINPYKEHGAGTSDLKNFHSQIKSFRTTLGTRFSYIFTRGNVDYNPEFFFAWQREFLLNHQIRDKFKALTPGSSTTTMFIPGINPNIAQFAVDMTFTFFKKYAIQAFYNLEWNRVYHDQSGFISANFSF